jgi:hypothetical protein
MRVRTQFAYLGIFGSFLVAPAVHAADNCTGHFHNVSQTSESAEIAKGFTLTTFVFNSLTSSDNSANNAMGTCSGYALTTPEGKTRLSGICARKTKNGDNWADTWASDPGPGDRGTWKLVEGSGVFAGKAWGGWWKVDFSEGKMTNGSWGGACN